MIALMARRGNVGKGRLVYSTNAGRVCPGCGWPARDCKCSQKAADESIPARIVAKLRMEKKGRAGKTVTVVDGLPQNAAFLKDLCQELKRACAPAAQSSTVRSSSRATFASASANVC